MPSMDADDDSSVTYLDDLSEPALVAAIEGNMAEVLLAMGQSPVAELYENSDVACLLTGIPFPPFNQVFDTRLSHIHIEARVREVTQRFTSKGLPALWSIESSAQPDDLGKHLEHHGWVRGESGGIGMALDLTTIREVVPKPQDLTIEVVDDEAKLRCWTQVAFPPPVADRCYELFSGLGLGLPWRHYLSLQNGRPVACAQLFLGAGVAGIYLVRTVPNARRRGIGAAVTLRALLDARDIGCHIAVLTSSSMGEAMYRRLGFVEYCRIGIYELPPGTNNE